MTPYRYIGIRGEVAEHTTQGADEHINQLSLKYDNEPWKYREGQKRIIYKIKPIHFDNTTDLHTFLRTRRSIRRFKADPVPDSVIENILTTATYAPSAHHRQPWRFAVVTNSCVKTHLADAMAFKMRADMQAEGADTSDDRKTCGIIPAPHWMNAPVVIILCRDKTDVRADTH